MSETGQEKKNCTTSMGSIPTGTKLTWSLYACMLCVCSGCYYFSVCKPIGGLIGLYATVINILNCTFH